MNIHYRIIHEKLEATQIGILLSYEKKQTANINTTMKKLQMHYAP